MRRLLMATVVMLLTASVASAGPIAEAIRKAPGAIDAQSAAGSAKPGHKGAIFLTVAGVGFLAVGAWALTQPMDCAGHANDPAFGCGANDFNTKNDRAHRATEVLCFGAGGGFLVWGLLKLRHPNAPRVEVSPQRLAVSQTFRF